MKITKQITNKLTVCVIIWLLVSVSIATFVMPAGADETNWQDISILPATITESGNYRITADLTMEDLADAITINASNVVLDGQNYTLTPDPDYYGIYATGVSNLTIVNVNILGGDGSIVLVDSNFTTIENCTTGHGFNEGIDIYNCSNFTITNFNATECDDTGVAISDCADFQITACNITLTGRGLDIDTCTNFRIESFYISNTTEYGGMEFWDCGEFDVTDSTILNAYGSDSRDAIGIDLYGCQNFNLINTRIENNSRGIELLPSKDQYCYNCTISSSTFIGSNETSIYASGHSSHVYDFCCQNITITGCTFANQSGMAIQGLKVDNLQIYNNSIKNMDFTGIGLVCTNSTITNNTFENNGFATDGGISYSAIGFGFSNITITDNIFNQNFDAIHWMVATVGESMAVDESVCTVDIQKNIFQNNSNTFRFDYEFPTSYDYQKLTFSNNLVNDTAYINPESLQTTETNLLINASVFNFNSTVSMGQRIQSIGPFVGGNYWAHPDGTGPSQTGTDENRDGFLDTPIELFGNNTVGTAYDYHPYSDNFDTEQWINITLPAEIYSPGHYRIMSSVVSDTSALGIYANNVTVDGGNFTIAGNTTAFYPAVYAQGVSNLTIENLTVQKSLGVLISGQNVILRNINTNNTLVGIYLQESVNVRVSDSRMEYAVLGLTFYYSENVTVSNCVIQNSSGGGIAGAYILYTNNFVLEDTVCSGTPDGSGLYLIECNSFQIKDCSFINNSIDGVTIRQCANFTLQDCTANSNGWGSEIVQCSNATIQNCQMSNNSQAIYMTHSNNLTFTNNVFSYNGLDYGAYTGGLEASDSNCTVINNLFESNYDAYIWNANHENITSNQNVYNNIFRNNNYTFFFVNQQPSNCTTQKLYFYNNLVNDTAYVDPVCFNATYSANYLPFNSTIFNLNTAQQAGTRIYSNGPNIGGNFWAHPDGTGPSQTGSDANRDGFLDTSFELFGNATIGTAYDYLPLSTSYTTATSGSTSTTTTTTTKPTVTPTPTPTPNTIQATKDDNTQITLAINGNITASQYTNAVISTNQTAATTTLTFTITGEHGTVGFSNITIAKSAIPVGTAPVVYIDGIRAENQGYTEDANNYYVWFTTGFSTHQIAVQFNGVVTPAPAEIPIWVYAAVIAVIVAVLAVAVIALKRKH